jgi:hypothetical protein
MNIHYKKNVHTQNNKLALIVWRIPQALPAPLDDVLGPRILGELIQQQHGFHLHAEVGGVRQRYDSMRRGGVVGGRRRRRRRRVPAPRLPPGFPFAALTAAVSGALRTPRGTLRGSTRAAAALSARTTTATRHATLLLHSPQRLPLAPRRVTHYITGAVRRRAWGLVGRRREAVVSRQQLPGELRRAVAANVAFESKL